jgi:cell wall-associated NlpC family hydrolase
MKRKRFIAIGVIALVMTGSGVAYGALAETGVSTPSDQQVTKPAPIIDSPVKKEVIISGPVKVQELQAGPVLTSDAPLVGSVDWMAQEKAEKDKIKADAEKERAELEAEAAKVQAELEAEIARLEKIATNTKKLNETLILVKNQIGKTPWVFGSSSPRAWDCSGLVRWAYLRIGVNLRHSATTQRFAGEFVDEPKIGDLVSFNRKGHTGAYHIGIYIGPNQMLHSGGKPGDRTEIRSIRGWAKDNGGSGIKYTRIIETNN